jgi:hypothetical protein
MVPLFTNDHYQVIFPLVKRCVKDFHGFAGDQWSIWSGGIGDCGVAMLLSVVLGGYHASSTYQWSDESMELPNEIFPVFYVTSRGKYSCTCTISDCGITVKLGFEVSGGNGSTNLIFV